MDGVHNCENMVVLGCPFVLQLFALRKSGVSAAKEHGNKNRLYAIYT